MQGNGSVAPDPFVAVLGDAVAAAGTGVLSDPLGVVSRNVDKTRRGGAIVAFIAVVGRDSHGEVVAVRGHLQGIACGHVIGGGPFLEGRVAQEVVLGRNIRWLKLP